MTARCIHVASFACLAVLFAAGCGTRKPATEKARVESAPADTGEVVNVSIAGRTVVVPAPARMVDGLARAKRMSPAVSIPRARDSDVRAILIPREEWRKLEHHGRPSDALMLFVTLEKGDQSNSGLNTFHFSEARDQWLSPGRWSQRSESRRLSAALEAWRAGVHDELNPPIVFAEDDPITVEVRSPDVRFIEVLTVGRMPGTPAGLCDVSAIATVLVRERVLDLMWTRNRMPFGVGALADASDGAARWADAVLQANP